MLALGTDGGCGSYSLDKVSHRTTKRQQFGKSVITSIKSAHGVVNSNSYQVIKNFPMPLLLFVAVI